MERWNNFLKSFETRGGNIFLLVAFSALLFVGVFHVLHHASDSGVNNVGTVIISTFNAFTGALLYALTGGGDKASEKKIN